MKNYFFRSICYDIKTFLKMFLLGYSTYLLKQLNKLYCNEGIVNFYSCNSVWFHNCNTILLFDYVFEISRKKKIAIAKMCKKL